MSPHIIGVTKNKFALFDNDEEVDPHELLKQQEQEKETRKKAKLAEKANAPKQPPRSAKTNSGPKATNAGKQNNPAKAANNPKKTPDSIPAQREGFKPRQSYPPANRKQENDGAVQRSFEETQNRPRFADRNGDWAEGRGDGSSGSESGTADRGRGGRRGGFARVFVRGGGRGRGGYVGEDRRKRDYDRHSGSDKTGVKPVDKRRAGGSFNWGSVDDEAKEAVEVVAAEAADHQEEAWVEGEGPAPPPPTEETPKEEDSPPEPESQQKELTLDEWKALKTSRPKPAYNLRKPGEGEDLTRWKDMVVLSKKAEDEEEEEEEELDYGEFPQRVGRQKRLELDVRFYDRFQDRRGRGRGGFRGRPTSGERASLPPPVPKVDDEQLFPSLVKAN